MECKYVTLAHKTHNTGVTSYTCTGTWLPMPRIADQYMYYLEEYQAQGHS